MQTAAPSATLAATALHSSSRTRIDTVLTRLDNALGYGTRKNPVEFWGRDEYTHVKHPVRSHLRRLLRAFGRLARRSDESGLPVAGEEFPAAPGGTADHPVVDATTTPARLWEQFGPRLARHPDRLAGMTARYQFTLTGEQGGHWYVDVRNGVASVAAGQIDQPDCTITLSDQDFFSLVTGELNAATALMSRRIKVRGNMALAVRTPKIFG